MFEFQINQFFKKEFELKGCGLGKVIAHSVECPAPWPTTSHIRAPGVPDTFHRDPINQPTNKTIHINEKVNYSALRRWSIGLMPSFVFRNNKKYLKHTAAPCMLDVWTGWFVG